MNGKEDFRKRLFSIIDHINRVRRNADILINRLIDEDRQDLALKLAAAISVHDQGKLFPFEFFGMHSDNAEIKKAAIQHHRETNRHHISYHSSHKEMSECDIAEMVVDQKARSEEFGQDLSDFFKKFIKDHKIPTQSYFYKKAIHFIDLILNQPFKEIKEIEMEKI